LAPHLRFAVALSAVVLIHCVSARGQTTPDADVTIATDRPSVTNSSVVVPQGGFQFENGMLMTDAAGQWTFDAPETSFRYGLFAKTELRLAPPDYFYNFPAFPGAVSGFGDMSIGVKQQLGPVWGFDVSLIVFVSLPVGAQRISSGGYDPGLQLPWSRKLSTNWTAAGQLATYWPTIAGTHNVTGEATFLVDRQLTGPWDAWIEYAGDFPRLGNSRQLLHAGTSYKITPWQQIDFHCAFGISSAAPHGFIGVGYSFLIRPSKGN
jgi:hypothetical protein